MWTLSRQKLNEAEKGNNPFSINKCIVFVGNRKYDTKSSNSLILTGRKCYSLCRFTLGAQHISYFLSAHWQINCQRLLIHSLFVMVAIHHRIIICRKRQLVSLDMSTWSFVTVHNIVEYQVFPHKRIENNYLSRHPINLLFLPFAQIFVCTHFGYSISFHQYWFILLMHALNLPLILVVKEKTSISSHSFLGQINSWKKIPQKKTNWPVHATHTHTHVQLTK